MSTQSAPLSPAERAAMVAALMQIRDRLDHASELLVALHLSQALDHHGDEEAFGR